MESGGRLQVGREWGIKLYIYKSPRFSGRNRGKSRQSRQHIDIDVDIDFHNEPKIRSHLPLINPARGRMERVVALAIYGSHHPY